MSSTYHFDHIHLLSRKQKAAADYYVKMFDAKATEGFTKDGGRRKTCGSR